MGRTNVFREIGCFLLLLLIPGDAFGEVPAARQMSRQAIEAAERGDYATATRLFRSSYELEPRPEAMCNLAVAFDRWTGHDREALNAYEQCAVLDQSGQYRGHATERANALRAIVGRERPTPLQGPNQPQPQPHTEPQPPPPPPPPPTRSRWQLWTGVAFGVLSAASLGVAIGMERGIAHPEHDYLERNVGNGTVEPGSQEEEHLNRGQAGATAAIAMYAVTGVFALTSVIFFVMEALAVVNARRGHQVWITGSPGGLTIRF